MQGHRCMQTGSGDSLQQQLYLVPPKILFVAEYGAFFVLEEEL